MKVPNQTNGYGPEFQAEERLFPQLEKAKAFLKSM